MNLKIGKTQRGFDLIGFSDRYKQHCSLQKSSLATEDAIWLGVDNTGELIDFCGKRNCEVNVRMHLTQDQVRILLPYLQAFVQKGDIV